MKIHRFYIYEQEEVNLIAGKVSGNTFHYQGSHLHQWKHVLRFHEGDEIILFNETFGEVKCVFETLHKDGADLKVLEIKDILDVQVCEITLFAPLIKRDMFELMLEKVTEVGVSNIVPLKSQFSQIGEINEERAIKILREATEQSNRIKPPALNPVVTINNDVHMGNVTAKLDCAFVLHPYQIEGQNNVNQSPLLVEGIKEFFATVKKQKDQPQILKVGLFVGPEGGFSSAEILDLVNLIGQSRTKIVSLGQTILRAETAAITSAFLVLQEAATQVR